MFGMLIAIVISVIVVIVLWSKLGKERKKAGSRGG